jgi:hypothetical protein
MNDNKKQLGQFYTTNYKYILQNLHIPDDINNIIEPFCGQGDLINFTNKKVECYDICPKQDYIIKRNTLLEPPDYTDKFVITNPPYLARNKSKDKTIFDKYNQNDLYKCLIDELTKNICIGGILIIPLNFFCSIRKNDIELKKKFLKKYNILTINIFEESVFDDTSYTICSFQFEKKQHSKLIDCYFYPSSKKINIEFTKQNNYMIGGEIYNLKQNNNIKVERITTNNKDNINKTNILVQCIDNNENNKITLSIVSDDKIFIDETPKLSARSYASLIIEPKITKEEEKKIVDKFNKYLNEQRTKYNSLFLTNYRENNRKRISFKLIFEIVNYLLSE